MKHQQVRSPRTNPVQVAMMIRHGRTTTAMKSRNAPRGGQRNEMAEMMAELVEAQDEPTESVPEM